ncbi:MAG TPA: 1-acyl-sn-glycerol-3-phosphate acyltransferase [Anaerolineales bacterium]|nr:1-acyl-sn-glycerol-3-phosphate acyltransferase [Anaerolineales bacterium]
MAQYAPRLSGEWGKINLMMYSLVMLLLRAILRVIARVTIYGMENLPPHTTSYVGVSNHIGRLDPAFVYYLLDRKDIIMLVAEKYQEHTWSRLLAQAVNGIFVDRYHADINAMREVLRRIQRGGVAVLAPEGTRSPNCALIQGWDGASYIAAKAGLPILPVGVTGTGDKEVVDRLKHLIRLQVTLSIGPTFTLPPLENKTRAEQLTRYTEEIMCRIASELPETYRGMYADHPRLQDLLREKSQRLVQPPWVVG